MYTKNVQYTRNKSSHQTIIMYIQNGKNLYKNVPGVNEKCELCVKNGLLPFKKCSPYILKMLTMYSKKYSKLVFKEICTSYILKNSENQERNREK